MYSSHSSLPPTSLQQLLALAVSQAILFAGIIYGERAAKGRAEADAGGQHNRDEDAVEGAGARCQEGGEGDSNLPEEGEGGAEEEQRGGREDVLDDRRREDQGSAELRADGHEDGVHVRADQDDEEQRGIRERVLSADRGSHAADGELRRGDHGHADGAVQRPDGRDDDQRQDDHRDHEHRRDADRRHGGGDEGGPAAGDRPRGEGQAHRGGEEAVPQAQGRGGQVPRRAQGPLISSPIALLSQLHRIDDCFALSDQIPLNYLGRFIIISELIMVNGRRIVLLSLLLLCALSEVYDIDLDLPADQRYTQLARTKKQSIASFISYLKQGVVKYKISFAAAALLHGLSPRLLRHKVGAEFYEECESIAKGASLAVSDVVVFNYMYELGAATDFCTAITVSSEGARLLGRNLDYGYQQFLASNSVHLRYSRGGEVVFETLGHAGLIGTHTVLKRASPHSPHQYAVTMNERVQGGLHRTLAKIISQRCETSPYALMRAVKECSGSAEDAVKYLNNLDTCSAVYWTVLSKAGDSYVIEKNRGIGSHAIRQAEIEKDINFLVQTNHDFGEADPDNRSTAARTKLINRINSNSLSAESIWQILTEAPNFNELTLMTGMIDVENGSISYKVWD